MKLLPAKELQSRLQDQKKSDIDAGLFLAKKIDRLREDLQTAQKEHDDSIAAMKLIEEEYASHYVSQKSKFEKEIKDAEEKLAELRKPLDEEWKKANELLTENIQKAEILGRTEQSIRDAESVIRELEKKTKSAETDSQNTLSETQKIKEKIIIDFQELRQSLEITKEYEGKIKKELQIRTENIEKRERNLEEREIEYKKNILAFNVEKKAIEMKKQRWNH